MQAPPGRCYRVLHDFGCYPAWWPEVKQVRQLTDSTAHVRIRAALPYSLSFEITRRRADAEAGLLEADMSGDLEGWSRWRIAASDEGSVLMFEEEARTNKALLNILSPVARPLFRLNHAVMMWRGERGLRRFVSRGDDHSGGL